MIWDSFMFVDHNGNGVMYLKHYFKVQYLTVSAHLFQWTRQISLSTLVQKINIASTILQSTKEIKNFEIS